MRFFPDHIQADLDRKAAQGYCLFADMASVEQPNGKEMRKHPRRKLNEPEKIGIWAAQSDGAWVRLTGELENLSEFGAGIVASALLLPGQPVLIDGANLGGGASGRAKGKVAWCGAIAGDKFRAGIALAESSSGSNSEGESSAANTGSDRDLYEILEVNPAAHPDTIHRVYRFLAQRLHPDNRDTGNEEAFKELIRAFRILSDPEQRAAYDAKRTKSTVNRWRLEEKGGEANGVGHERKKRSAVLSLLYAKRLREPNAPGLSLIELEELLGVPREHLEFTMWFLREQSWIARTDNGRYSITIRGVEQAEVSESPEAARAPERHLLEAAH